MYTSNGWESWDHLRIWPTIKIDLVFSNVTVSTHWF